ncbi:Methyltransferase type 12 [Solidesulfovibrio fructosivorans JJ]]|uniref:Methyltransferase type 12 n=1 Tax=Solidesulfovibrio fructosivorans JJ] TaxID=596151 RepID=E1JVR4_SOLFR|nr:methyltransferase domain-containing protein [Solidesulfovibrio fructosivorans]EFL51552.1 Methyltransferase type 12 [Solidesulfovibrio fructosivorans JJ]]
METEIFRLEVARRLLAGLDPACVWRPVYGPDGTLLAPGHGPGPDELESYIGNLDVVGKSVVDLGCNLGYFAFRAAWRGATRVLGCDVDPDVIRTARELARLHGLDNVDFSACDFLCGPPAAPPCEMAMLIDFIGRGVISKGRLESVAKAAAAWASKELFFTLRPAYRLDDLPASPAELERLYPGHVRGGHFHLADALAERLGPDWSPRRLTGSGRVKAALLFTRVG